MEGIGQGQHAREAAPFGERCRQLLDRDRLACKRHLGWRVDGRDMNRATVRRQQLARLVFRNADRRHSPGASRTLLCTRAFDDKIGHILLRERSRNVRRRNLAQAVPEDAGGNNAPGLQEASQRDLHCEQHRLSDVALKNRIVARCKTLREAVTPLGPHQGIEPFDCRPDEGHVFEQLPAHAWPLPTLPRKDEYDIAGVFARVTGDGLAHVRLAGPPREAPCRFVRVVRNDHQTVGMVAAAALHRGGELAETLCGIAEKRRVARHGFAQRFLRPGRHGPQIRGRNHACRVASFRSGRGRQNRMRVGAAEPERIDAGAKQVGRRARAPFEYPGGNGELQRFECDLGIR